MSEISILSIRLGISVALMEIAVGVIGGNVLQIEITSWVNFLAGFGAVVLTFLAGALVSFNALYTMAGAILCFLIIKIAAKFTTVFRGLMGYGANSRIHTASIVDLSSDLPILVEIVDSEEYINKLMPYLDEMLQEGLVIIDDIEVIKYGKTTPKRNVKTPVSDL